MKSQAFSIPCPICQEQMSYLRAHLVGGGRAQYYLCQTCGSELRLTPGTVSLTGCDLAEIRMAMDADHEQGVDE